MNVERNVSLKNLNSFRVDARAKYFVEVKSEKDIHAVIKNRELSNLPAFILGKGSNVLFTKNFDGVVIKSSVRGRKIIEDADDHVVVEVGAGEIWHDLVSYAARERLGGIENLALIPGTVGAAPIQNIAAYGQNFSDVFHSLDAIDLKTGELRTFHRSECEFDYRTSIFKKDVRGRYIIIRVRIRLSKRPILETSYYQVGIARNSIVDELKKISAQPYTIRDVYNAVINIRTRKFPNSDVNPNAGSSFLNPVVSVDKLEELRSKVSELQWYPVDQLLYREADDTFLKKSDSVKVAVGRLLEKRGWLGKWIGNCGIHDKSASIIVTNGRADGGEILNFMEMIRKDFFDGYGIWLESEINII